jgi:hypothetical protein
MIGFNDNEIKSNLLSLRTNVLKRYDCAQVKTDDEIKAEKKKLELMALELEFIDFKSDYYKV